MVEIHPLGELLNFRDGVQNVSVVEQLRVSGFDAVSTPEARRLGESDESQLDWATQENRVLAKSRRVGPSGAFVRINNSAKVVNSLASLQYQRGAAAHRIVVPMLETRASDVATCRASASQIVRCAR